VFSVALPIVVIEVPGGLSVVVLKNHGQQVEVVSARIYAVGISFQVMYYGLIELFENQPY